jgi:hypothetical protein
MTLYDAIRDLHITAGAIALATFWSAASLRKGSSAHRIVGRTYLVSMAMIATTGVYIALNALTHGRPIFGSFLMYLVVIVATPTWLGWRAVREKRDVKGYTGPIYHALAWVNIAAGVTILTLGIAYDVWLFAALSAVALITGPLMIRFARQEKPARQWWLQRHYVLMLGAGVGTHVAFLNLGLSHLVSSDWTTTVQHASFGLPFVVFLIARLWLDRKYGLRGGTKQRAYGEAVAGTSV